RLDRVPHVLLDAEVVHAQIKMQRSCHANGTQISRSVRSGSHLIHLGEIGNFSQVRNAACMDDRGANVIDELFLNELLAVVDCVEHLANRQGRGRVLANQTKAFLQLCWCGILHPEKMKRFQGFAETSGLDWSQPMMDIMQKMQVGGKFLSQARK